MNNKGFTLVELLAAVVIMGILSTIAVVEVRQYLKKSKDISVDHEFQSAYLAADACVMESGMNTGTLDEQTSDSQDDPCTDRCESNCTLSLSKLIEKGYLEKTNCDADRSTVRITDSGSSAYGLRQYEYSVHLECNSRVDDQIWPRKSEYNNY